MAYQRWHVWILVPSWITHIAILIRPATTAFFSLFVNAVSCSQSSLWHSRTCSLLHTIAFVVELACIATEVCEIQFYKQGRLRPVWYLASQLFKSVVFSYWLYGSRNLLTYSRLRIIFAVEAFKTASFYATLLYSCYIIYQEGRLKSTSTAANRALRSTNNGDDDMFAAFAVPPRINSTDRLRAKRPVVISFVQWINAHPTWIDNTPYNFRVLFDNGYYFVKCIACYIPVYVTVPWSARLPGEPTIAGLSYGLGIRSRKPDSARDWDYPKPNLLQPGPYDLIDDRAHGVHVDDEEAVLGLVNLPHVHERIRSSEIQRAHESTPSSRVLGPRYLCFLTGNQDEVLGSKYRVCKVDDWLAQNDTKAVPDYVFISYTRRQFYTQTQFDPTITPELLSPLQAAANRDKQTLTDFAVLAAKAANVHAFWVDFECVKHEEGDTEKSNIEDVYRICDVVRAAYSLAIVLGPSLDSTYQHTLAERSLPTEWLLEWGMRMWTVPEALLCPSEHRIAVYSVGSYKPDLVAKRNLAGRTWEDASAIRQLIDHYEGSLHLTQVELISIAMECLQRRQTEKRNAGDITYVLMGLLRVRPKVNQTDSDFQAFARLSLANDSGKTLERILCLHGAPLGSGWCNLRDVWKTKTWQIHPLFQITDVGQNDDNTVMIANAQGTIIDWNSLKSVDFRCDYPSFRLRWYLNRGITTIGLVWCMAWLYITFVAYPAMGRLLEDSSFTSTAQSVLNRFMGPGFILHSLVNLQTPFSLARHFRAIPTAMQARMFGIQGKADLNEVEKLMFGTSCGRLKWNARGLEHQPDSNDERQEYTLIDTLLGTATLIRTSRPPTFVFAGGQEANYLRLLLCSYDNIAQAFVKETVLRTKLVVAEHMQRLDPFYLAAARTVFRDEPSPLRHSFDSDAIDIPDIPEFRSLDD